MVLIQLDARSIQILLVVLSVPIQYWLTVYFTGGSQTRNDLLSDLLYTSEKIFSLRYWRGICDSVIRVFTLSKIPQFPPFDSVPQPETGEDQSALKAYYGSSQVPRNRPESVKFRVGDVIRHVRWKYRGVIVGWDPVGQAPEEWFRTMYPKEHRERWRLQPTYRILVDTRDRPAPQYVYVPQENIEWTPPQQIIHPLLEEYFEKFNGLRYELKPRYKRIYPNG